MAANLLPFLLLGGAAAYVVTTQNKLKEEKEKCPKTNKVSTGSIIAVADRAYNKFKAEPDPSPQANYCVNQLLPGACNRTSDSEVIVTFEDAGVDATVTLTIPELYMIFVGNIADKKLQEGLLTQEKYEQIHNREMQWYKNTVGEPFNPAKTAEKFGPLAIAITKAVMDDAKNGGIAGGKKKTVPRGNCPSTINIDVEDMTTGTKVVQTSPGETMQINMPDRAFLEGERGNRDLIDITKKVFRDITPEGCLPTMEGVTIVFKGDGHDYILPAPRFYFLLAMDILEDFYQAGWYSEQEATAQYGALQLWWESTMGNRDYPEV